MAFTLRQNAQIKSAPAAQKAALRAAFTLQNQQKAGSGPKPKSQAAPAKSRLARTTTNAGPGRVALNTRWAFNGFDRRHLPLDETTSPYITTNFVSIMEFGSSATVDQVIVICPRQLNPQENNQGPLTDIIAIRYDCAETIDGAMPNLGSTRCPIVDAPPITAAQQYTSVRARLHNLSVAVECLGTSGGLFPPGSVYMGSVPYLETGIVSGGAQMGLTIKTAWVDDATEVGYLRSHSAINLIGRPHTIHTTIAENISYRQWRDIVVPAISTDVGSLSFNTAMEPVLVYVPRTGAPGTVVNYRINMGQQWCSRHPHSIIIRASQKQHPATDSSMWRQATAAATAVGDRVMGVVGDIAADAIVKRFTGLPGSASNPLVVD